MAVVIIRRNADLNKVLNSKIEAAMKSTQDIIAICIQESINDYYKEKVFRNGSSSIPEYYDRTYVLLKSLVKTSIVRSGSTWTCEVKIDENHLNHVYVGGTTGFDILSWNEEDGSHGKTVPGDWKIWTQAMQTLSGDSGVMALFKSKLKKYGLIK